MKRLTRFIIIVSVLSLTPALAQRTNLGSVYNCAAMPKFINDVGLQQPVAIDTTISKLPGLVLRELANKRRLYQKKGWEITGHISSTVRDGNGNIYVIPVPSIGLDTNPLASRNIVYKVLSSTGDMQKFVELPLPDEDSQKNPFGTVGMAFDCETNSLYVSSVASSTPEEVKGRIYQIDAASGEILSRSPAVDALGLSVFRSPTGKVLYYGDARSSSLYSRPLNSSGGFSNDVKPTYVLSLLDQKNGDSTQVRKIRFSLDELGRHSMQIADTEFSFRMAAETGRQYRNYVFWLDTIDNQWKLQSISPQ